MSATGPINCVRLSVSFSGVEIVAFEWASGMLTSSVLLLLEVLLGVLEELLKLPEDEPEDDDEDEAEEVDVSEDELEDSEEEEGGGSLEVDLPPVFTFEMANLVELRLVVDGVSRVDWVDELWAGGFSAG